MRSATRPLTTSVSMPPSSARNVWQFGATLDTLRADDGGIDTEAVSGLVADLIKDRPGLRAPQNGNIGDRSRAAARPPQAPRSASASCSSHEPAPSIRCCSPTPGVTSPPGARIGRPGGSPGRSLTRWPSPTTAPSSRWRSPTAPSCTAWTAPPGSATTWSRSTGPRRAGASSRRLTAATRWNAYRPPAGAAEAQRDRQQAAQ